MTPKTGRLEQEARMKIATRGLAVLSGLLIAASTTPAHDTWMGPRSFRAAVGSPIVIELTSGMNYPALEVAIKPDRVATASMRLGGKVSSIDARTTTRRSLSLRARPSIEGIATIWATLAPKALDLTPAQVEGYLDEIGASDEVRKAWASSPEPRVWHETYAKHAKTFVRVGRSEGDRSWADPVGMRLELVPEVDPTALKSGDEIVVRVLRNGGAAAGFAVGLVGPNGKSVDLRRADVDGRVTFRIGSAGRWMLRGTDLRMAPGTGNWESDFTTLTFEAASPNRRKSR